MLSGQDIGRLSLGQEQLFRVETPVLSGLLAFLQIHPNAWQENREKRDYIRKR